MTQDTPLPWQQESIIIHTQRLLKSYQHWTGQLLFDLSTAPEELAQELFTAPFVVVSHGTEADPIFNYANQAALDLWELSWSEFTQMPSRKSVRDTEIVDRESLLKEAATKGFVSNYSGVRISSSGKRFYFENVIVWNILDENNHYCGQATMFWKWKYV